MDKHVVMKALLDALRTDLAAVERVARMATDEATGEESRPENEYDTRGLEASYLARGQAERVVALRRLVGFFESVVPNVYDDETPLGLCALVETEDEQGSMWCFLAPAEGGRTVVVDGVQVKLVTPESPLGRALVGSVVGDEVTLQTPGAERSLEIVSAH